MNEENTIPTAPVNPAPANPAAAAAPGVVNPPMAASEMFQPEPVGSEVPGAEVPGAAAGVTSTPGATSVPGAAPAMPGMLGAMDPLTMPEKPAEPDPVEEELKAPLKAAAPVPGSIGSAVSAPAAGATAPQNVAFNDPAAENLMAEAAQAQVKAAGGKPKISKQTLILLCAVAGVLIIALVIVLVMMLSK